MNSLPRPSSAVVALLVSSLFAAAAVRAQPNGVPPPGGALAVGTPARPLPGPGLPQGPATARPMPPAPPDAAAMAQASVSGRVTRLLLNPNGDVDGFLLEDGTQVATPPHWSARIVDVIKGHDPVTVTGQRANDGSVVRAAEVRADASGRSVTDNGPDGAPPVPREPSPLVPLSANGRIAAVLHTDRGDVDGVVLENGTSVRFPPPAGVQFSDLLKPGQMLYAEGYGTTNDLGRALEATQLGASRRGRQEVFAPPPGPDGGLPVGRPVVPPPPGIVGQP